MHETLVHLRDLRAAAGAEVDGIGAEVWADTVDEAVTVMYPRQVRLGRTQAVSHAVSLVASDADSAWRLARGIQPPWSRDRLASSPSCCGAAPASWTTSP